MCRGKALEIYYLYDYVTEFGLCPGDCVEPLKGFKPGGDLSRFSFMRSHLVKNRKNGLGSEKEGKKKEGREKR